MQDNFRTVFSFVAAALVAAALGGASLPPAAIHSTTHPAVQPVAHRPVLVTPHFHAEAVVLSDKDLVHNAAPQRAILAEQAREAAAAVAQAAAAQAAAAAALARQYTINVWTVGFQNEIDACRGAVDMSRRDGFRDIAEHWSCGGSTFPRTPGSIVRLTGLDAGTYRVIGLVATLDAFTALTDQVPDGYQILFQTCLNGDSHTTEFFAMQQIG
jgi:hypothetical protein